MAFFKKQPKRNPLIDVELIEKDYKTLYDALEGELDMGSQDTKETIVHFADRSVIIRSVAGSVKVAFVEGEVVPLDSRVYWSKLEGTSVDKMMALSKVKVSDLLHNYKTLADSEDSRDLVRDIFRAHTIATLQKTAETFADHQKIRSELINDSDVVSYFDFFSVNPKEIKDEVSRLNAKEAEHTYSLGISSFNPDEVKLELGDSTVELKSDADRFIHGAADTGATLRDTKDLSFGFVWEDVLRSLKRLVNEGAVSINYPGKDVELPEFEEIIAIPASNTSGTFTIDKNDEDPVSEYIEGDLEISLGEGLDIENPFEDDEMLEDKGAVLVSRELPRIENPIEGLIVESVENNHQGFTPVDDDGDFMYETIDDENENTVCTSGLDDNIDADVRRLMKNNSIGPKIREFVNINLDRNSTLEYRLVSIEKSISSSRERFQAHVGDFEELKFEKSIEQLSDASEVGRENFDHEVIAEKQNKSNVSFFNVSELEEERYSLNTQRRDLLMSLHAMISEMLGEEVQSILHRIETKVSGIDQVSNVAFHSPVEDDTINVDPEILAAFDAASKIELSYDDAPTFFSLVSSFGFDPINASRALTQG